MSVNVKSGILMSDFFSLEEGVCLFFSCIEDVYMLLSLSALNFAGSDAEHRLMNKCV